MHIDLLLHCQRLNVSVRGTTVCVWCAVTKARWQARIAANPKVAAVSLLAWLVGRVESPAEFLQTRFPAWASKLS